MTTRRVVRDSSAAKWAVKVGVDAGANGLQCQAHGFACDGGEAFEAEDIVGADHVGHLFCEGGLDR